MFCCFVMDSDLHERYFVVDSQAFVDLYQDSNTPKSFTNKLLPPLNNWCNNLEIALIDVYIKGQENDKFTVYNVSCDIIEPYQYGEGQCQIIRALGMIRLDIGVYGDEVKAENMYQSWDRVYHPVKRGIHNFIELSLSGMFPSNHLEQDLHHTAMLFHVRTVKSREQQNLFMK